MHFMKISALGQDYIFFDGVKACDYIEKADIKRICDRTVGVGSEGIFVINQNEPENARIRAFNKNGLSMQDESTALICACLGQNIAAGGKSEEIASENQVFFARIFPSDDDKQAVICSMKSAASEIAERKTEVGNRILSLVPVVVSGVYLVHFTACMELLNFTYLCENAARITKYGKNAALLFAQMSGRNRFILSQLYDGKDNIVPYAGGFAAVALAACNTGRCNFSEEIELICKDFVAYAVCKEDGSVLLYACAELIYEGNI